MTNSYSEHIDMSCPYCDTALGGESWLLIDGVERPDLLDRIRDGTLNIITCLHCGRQVSLDTPLLLYRPGETPPLLFSPAQNSGSVRNPSRIFPRTFLASAWESVKTYLKALRPTFGRSESAKKVISYQNAAHEQTQQQKTALLEQLRSALGPAWDQRWEDTVPDVPRPSLAIALSEGLEAAQAHMRLLSYFELLQELSNTPNLAEAQQIVESHPELLRPEVDDLLDQLMVLSEKEGHTDLVRTLTRHQQTLRQCRKIGVTQAFADLTMASDPAARLELESVLHELFAPRDQLAPSRRIELCQRALGLGHQDQNPQLWAALHVELGNCLIQQRHGDRAESVEQAIASYDEALQLLAHREFSVQRAHTLVSLAHAYQARLRGDRADNLEKAIELCQRALSLVHQDQNPQLWAALRVSLAHAYQARLRGDRADNLEKAIATYQSALEVFRAESMPFERAHVIHNLACAYGDRLDGDRTDNLEQAIAYYEQCLEVFTRDSCPIEWSAVMTNLGNAYNLRVRGDRAENVDQAIAIYQQALQVRSLQAMPADWATTKLNLATAYYARPHGDRGDNVARAIAAYRDAVDGFRAAGLWDDCWRAARSLGNVFFEEGRWPEAVEAYQQALLAGEDLARTVTEHGRQLGQLVDLADLYRHTAYAQVRLGQLEAAVVTLERSQRRGLTPVLAGNESDLERLRTNEPQIYFQYQQAAQLMCQLEAVGRSSSVVSPEHRVRLTSEALRDRAQHVSTVFRNTVENIRRLPGYHDFPAEADFTTITRAVTPDQPLVYLVTTSAGSLVLIVYQGHNDRAASYGIEAELADNFTSADLDALLLKRHGDKVIGGYLPSQLRDPQALVSALDELLPILGQKLVGLLAKRLRDLGVQSAVLVPVGNLSVLPLHTACYEIAGQEKCLLDEFDISYTTSAAVLAAARRSLAERQVGQPLLEAVVMPQPSETPRPYAQAEIQAITGYFSPQSCRLLKGTEATKEAFLRDLSTATHVHLACHSLYDPQEPSNSYIQLANGEVLTQTEAIASERFLRARLVVLSACQTASAVFDEQRPPGQSVGPPVSFLQSVAPGVITTLWPVNDVSNVLLMSRFYEYHIAYGALPARALRSAQLWLRNASAKELVQALRAFAAGHTDVPEADREAAFDELAVATLRLSLEEPEARVFASPYYWSTFYCLGV